jgi:hypothetical protein
VNPGHIVTVIDFDPETLTAILAHIRVSTTFEHLVYREAELDALWSLTDFYVRTERDAVAREAAAALHRAVHQAHDFIGESRPFEAMECLRPFAAA